MSDKKDGGPAFPQIDQSFQPGINGGQHLVSEVTGGMSLRDWFAGQALIGLLSDSEVIAQEDTLARLAYEQADAMLAAREKSDA